MALGTWRPELPVLKNVLNGSSQELGAAVVSSKTPSGPIPCSRQNSSQQAFPIWTPAWPTWIEMHSLCRQRLQHDMKFTSGKWCQRKEICRNVNLFSNDLSTLTSYASTGVELTWWMLGFTAPTAQQNITFKRLKQNTKVFNISCSVQKCHQLRHAGLMKL